MSDGKKGELQFMTVTSPRLDVSESNEHIENLLETTYVDIEKANVCIRFYSLFVYVLRQDCTLFLVVFSLIKRNTIYFRLQLEKI